MDWNISQLQDLMAVEDKDLGTTQEVYYNVVIFNIETH